MIIGLLIATIKAYNMMLVLGIAKGTRSIPRCNKFKKFTTKP